jgi:hypothetical protein
MVGLSIYFITQWVCVCSYTMGVCVFIHNGWASDQALDPDSQGVRTNGSRSDAHLHSLSNCHMSPSNFRPLPCFNVIDRARRTELQTHRQTIEDLSPALSRNNTKSSKCVRLSPTKPSKPTVTRV